MSSLDVSAPAWAVTLALIAALFAIDLFLSGRRPHRVEFREAIGWSVFYIGVAVAFGIAFGTLAGWRYGAEYFAGYIVEKSLSVDNLFVFLVIMEITESNMVSDSSGVATVLDRLRQIGVCLAIDDFGTGYSSLAYLKHMPVSEVKVDRSFVTGMTEDPTNQTLVSSIVALGHELGLRVVGEGVEDQASLSALRALGCDAAQGFQISKPLSAEELFLWAAQPRLLAASPGSLAAHSADWGAMERLGDPDLSCAVPVG